MTSIQKPEGVSGLSLRAARADDAEFLFELYCDTRREEMAPWGWSAEQARSFLSFQFKAQQSHYEAGYEGADHKIILIEGREAGRILVLKTTAEFCLVDIALMSEHRGKGVGAALIRDLLDEAGRAGLPVTLYVLKGNPAARLYERLGFRFVKDTGAHLKMERRLR
jgi:GNAT superfamily N-acetyltransferase